MPTVGGNLVRLKEGGSPASGQLELNVIIRSSFFTLTSSFIYLISFPAAGRKRPTAQAREPPAQVGGPPLKARRNATSGEASARPLWLVRRTVDTLIGAAEDQRRPLPTKEPNLESPTRMRAQARRYRKA